MYLVFYVIVLVHKVYYRIRPTSLQTFISFLNQMTEGKLTDCEIRCQKSIYRQLHVQHRCYECDTMMCLKETE